MEGDMAGQKDERKEEHREGKKKITRGEKKLRDKNSKTLMHKKTNEKDKNFLRDMKKFRKLYSDN